MRRTVMTTQGFRAPRPRGSHEPSSKTLVSSSNPNAPPPPTSESSARKVSACSSVTARPFPSLPSSSSPRKGGGSVQRALSTAVAATGDTGACSSPMYPRSDPLSSTVALQGPLGGHFGANHLRRKSRREDRVVSRHDITTAATTVRASVESPAVVTTTAQHVATHVRVDDGTLTAGSSGLSCQRKRTRSPSVEDLHSGGVQERNYMTKIASCAPSARACGDESQFSGTASRSEPIMPRLRSVRHFSTANVTRTVFYPSPAEPPVLLRREPPEADCTHAVGAPVSMPSPDSRRLSVMRGACATSDNSVQTHPSCFAAASTEQTEAGTASAVSPAVDAPLDPGSQWQAGVSNVRRSSSVPLSGCNTIPSDLAMTVSAEASLSTESGERFLSALEHQRRDYPTPLARGSYSSPSPSPLEGLPYTGGAPHLFSEALHSLPSTPRVVSSISTAQPLPLLTDEHNSPLPTAPPQRASESEALPSANAIHEASLLQSGLRHPLSSLFSSPPHQRVVQPPSPPLADVTPASSACVVQAEARVLVPVPAGENQIPPSSSVAFSACLTDVGAHVTPLLSSPKQLPVSPCRMRGVAEETKGEACDDALEQEIDEDLRLSTDVAFTPSGTGSGAPPFFSQSSMMQEGEEQVEADGCPLGIDIKNGGVAILTPTSDGVGLCCTSRMYDQASSTGSILHSQEEGAGGLPMVESPQHSPAVVLPASDPRVHPNPGGVVDTAPADSGRAAQLRFVAGFTNASADLQSAPPTRPVSDVTAPPPPSVLVPGAGLLPLGTVTASVAVGGGRCAGAEGMGRGRHRTVFSLRSMLGGGAMETAPPDPLVDPSARLRHTSEVPALGESCSISATSVSAPVPGSSSPGTCAASLLPDVSMPHALPGAPASDFSDFLPTLTIGSKPKAERCEAEGSAAAVSAPPPPPPPWGDTLPPSPCKPTLWSSDATAQVVPSCLDAGSNSSGALCLPGRPGRTCFKLHSVVPTSSSLSAAAVVEPTTTAPIRSIDSTEPTLSPSTKLLGEKSCCQSGSAEQPYSPGSIPVSPQQAATLVSTAEVVADATLGITTRLSRSVERTCTPFLNPDSLTNAHAELPRSTAIKSPTAAVYCAQPSPVSADAAGYYGEPAMQRLTSPPPMAAVSDQQQISLSSYNHVHPLAPSTVAPMAPFVEHVGTALASCVAPHGAQASTRDVARPSHPRGQDEMPFSFLSPLLPATAGDTEKNFYDLPPAVGHFYATRRGITSLYPWQHDLISCCEVRQGCSFIYSLPTSGGKTLVAELSLLRCVLNRRKSSILVLPFVSLAEEKTVALQQLTVHFNFKVDGHYGSCGRFPLCEAPAIYVCTIEKANSLMNHMLEEGRSDEIGAVVVDELHMVGESRRGATLELLLSKVLMINVVRQRRRESVNSLARERVDHPTGVPGVHPREAVNSAEEFDESAVIADTTVVAADPGPLQIIGMSATIPNLHTIAQWLRAKPFECDFRPVPLRAYSVVGGLVLRDGLHNERNLSGGSVTQHLLELATEAPDASVLIFCASRQECVDTAKGIVNYLRAQAIAGQNAPSEGRRDDGDAMAKAQSVSVLGVPFPALTRSPTTAASMAAVPSQASAAIKGLLADLEALAHYEASQLSDLIPFGVAFHHGGLVAEERDLIETAFRRKHLRILCCTSTLAAGVNLPARRVIIKSPYVGRDFLTKSRYMQMCGRAGRAGLDPYGESFLLLSRRDQTRGHALMHASVEPCCSQILEDDQTLTRSLLECVGVGLVSDCLSACEWSNSLLSRWAVGPVDAAWKTPMSTAAALDTPDTVQDSSLASTGNTKGGTAAAVCFTSPVACVDASAPAQSCEAGGSAHLSSPSRAVFPPLPQLARVSPVAMNAIVHVSLNTLARCGLIRIIDVCKDSSGDDGATSLENCKGDSSVAPGTCTGGWGAVAADTTAGKSSNATSKADVEKWMSSVADGLGCTDPSTETRGAVRMQVRVTPFGSSSVRSCFSVEEALLLRDELDELRHNGLILSDDLHLCYFLTPLREVGRCDWNLLRLMMSRMSDSRQRIASLLGVDAYFIDQQAMGLGAPLEATDEGKRRLFTAKRFYVALMLADVLAEVPMTTVEQRYHVNRGQLQNLMRSASMFSSSITSFCHAMEWFSLEAVLSSFVKRLGFGVKPDLLPLMEIRGMQPPRARALWNAGFKHLSAIAAADADEMVSKVKAMNTQDCRTAKFFTKRSALIVIREANLALQSQIQEKKGELQELTIRGGVGVRGGNRTKH